MCCPRDDSAAIILKNKGIRMLPTADLDADMAQLLQMSSDGVGFSINNSRIIHDKHLDTGVSFFNIHAGLVQRYRGLAEICIFAALCQAEHTYGVTLHRILPGDAIDCGPVLAQSSFDIAAGEGFADVLGNALSSCQRLFEQNVRNVLSNHYEPMQVSRCERAYSYKDVRQLCIDVAPNRLARATDLREYRSSFPRLTRIIEEFCAL